MPEWNTAGVLLFSDYILIFIITNSYSNWKVYNCLLFPRYSVENTTSKLFGLFSLKNHYSVHWGVHFKAFKGITNKRLAIGGIRAIDKETNRQSDKQLNRQKHGKSLVQQIFLYYEKKKICNKLLKHIFKRKWTKNLWVSENKHVHRGFTFSNRNTRTNCL